MPIIQNPYTGQLMKTENQRLANFLMSQFQKPIEVTYKDLGRGGIGEQLDRFGNFFGGVGAGIGAVFGGDDPIAAMQNFNQQNQPRGIAERMTMDEYQNFLASNPNLQIQARNPYTGELLTDQTGQKASMGWLDDAIGGMISPFPSLLETSGEIGGIVGQDLRHLMQPQPEGVANLGQLWDTRPEKQPLFMTQDRFSDFKSAPGLRLGQDLAGVGAFLIPGGSGIRGLAASGAASGFLSGLGQAKTQDIASGNFTDPITGAVFGGGTGAAMGVAGKAIRGLANKLKGGSKTIASGADDFADILQPAGGLTDEGAVGLGTGSAKPFNNYLNNMGIDDASSLASRAKLQRFANRAAEAAKQGIADADEVLGTLNSLYEITPNTGIATATGKAGGLSAKATKMTPEEKVDNFIDTFVDQAPTKFDEMGRPVQEGNFLQRFGSNADFELAGIQPQAGPNMYDEFITTKNAFRRAADSLGVGLDPKGIQTIQKTAVEAKDRLLSNSGWNGASMSDLSDEMVRLYNQNFAAGQIGKAMDRESIVKNFLSNYLDEATLKGAGYKGTSEQFLRTMLSGGSEGVQMNPKLMESVRQQIEKVAVRANRKLYGQLSSPLTPTEEIAYAVDTVLKKSLQQNVPGYQGVNQLLASGASRGQDMAAAFARGNQVSSKGRINIMEMIGGKGLEAAGKAATVAGNMMEGGLPRPNINLPNVNLPNTPQNIGEMASQAVKRGLPIAAANQATGMSGTIQSTPTAQSGTPNFFEATPMDIGGQTIMTIDPNSGNIVQMPAGGMAGQGGGMPSGSTPAGGGMNIDYDGLAMEMLQRGYSPSEVQSQIQSLKGMFDAPQQSMASLMSGIQNVDPSMQRSVLASQLMDAGYSPNDVKTMTDLMLGSGGKPLTGTAKKTQYELSSAQNNLELLGQTIEEYGNRFSPIFGQDIFGLPAQILDPERNKVETTMKSVVQAIAKDLEGGRLTDADREFYAQFTPTIKDTPEAAKQKLAALYDLLAQKQAAFEDTYYAQ